MTKIIEKWGPDNILAAVIVIGCLTLLLCGIDGEVKAILAACSAWIFKSAYDSKRSLKQ